MTEEYRVSDDSGLGGADTGSSSTYERPDDGKDWSGKYDAYLRTARYQHYLDKRATEDEK